MYRDSRSGEIRTLLTDNTYFTRSTLRRLCTLRLALASTCNVEFPQGVASNITLCTGLEILTDVLIYVSTFLVFSSS